MWHRKPVVAGSFYPSNPVQLKKEIDGYLDAVPERKLKGDIAGVVCPHAGYMYSGQVAAYSYKQLIGSGIEIAIVMAPSHRGGFSGASVINSGIYETPLGELEIDDEIGNALLKEDYFSFIKEAHSAEHSLEVQVPFLQTVLEDFRIVPIVIGSYDINTSRRLADGLYNCTKNIKKKVGVVISTDLSHYHSYEQAKKIDGAFIKALETADEELIDNVIAMNQAEACGHGIFLCKKYGAGRIEILHYANSGDSSGSKGEVVGYVSAAILK
jgi:AmmeMemoRadiSam system protein B